MACRRVLAENKADSIFGIKIKIKKSENSCMLCDRQRLPDFAALITIPNVVV